MEVSAFSECFLLIVLSSEFILSVLQNSNKKYAPGLLLIARMFCYLNYTLLYPMMAVNDNEVLIIMHDTWRMPFAHKKGSLQVSRAPNLIPQHCTLPWSAENAKVT